MQGVKPAARLVDSFADEISRVSFAGINERPVLERVVPLRERHGPGIEPDVDKLRYPPHRAPAGAVERDIIHERFVEVERLLHPAPLPVFGHAPDAFQRAALLTHPDGERCPPETVAREGPVLVLLEPVAEPPLADFGGTQVICLFSSIIRFAYFVVLMYHESRA